MCLTAANAELAKTAVYTGEALVEGEVVHVTFYENEAVDLSPPGVGNAMLLAVPTKGAITFIDTSKCPRILKDMRKALPMGRGSLSKSAGDRNLGAVTVTRCGIYTCVVAGPLATMSAIRRAIDMKVPADERPPLTDAYIEGIRGIYRRARLDKMLGDISLKSLIIACFSNKRKAEAHPIGYWYEPSDPERLFFPALDDHRGQVPKAGDQVERDHVLLAGSYRSEGGLVARYSDVIPDEVKPYLPVNFCGEMASGYGPNGDFSLPTESARHQAVSIEMLRLPPHGLR
jgi:hypothetical protein